MTVLGERVLVTVVEAEEKSAGGIFIPKSSKEEIRTGVVIGVGDLTKSGVKVKKGDKVIFDDVAGSTLRVDGKDCIMLRAEDILAVVV